MEIQGLLDKTINNIKNVADSKNIIGTPIHAGEDTIIIPVSKMTFGFLTGGGEYSESEPKRLDNELPYAGGSGGGVNVTPIGFLVSNGAKTSFLRVEANVNSNKWTELLNSCVNLATDYLSN